MSKGSKKKPGDLAAAKRRHLRRQEIQDAITAVKRGETVRLWWPTAGKRGEGRYWLLSPVTDAWWNFPSSDALVRVNGSRLVIAWVYEKDGVKACSDRLAGSFYVHDSKQVLAIATPADVQ